MSKSGFSFVFGCLVATAVFAGDGRLGNRFAHLDDPINPYWVSLSTARLVTPQWVGERDIDAVAILSIDDMRDPLKYETFLRPLIDRIKRYQGRAGFTIFTNSIDPYDPLLMHLQNQGGSIEVHTLTHPCPLLQKRDLFEAKRTFDGCVDLLSRIPGGGPVGYRMPCCDSMNSVSPRFFDVIFNRTTPNGRFLEADSSVFLVLDAADPELERDWVIENDGRDRFRKYIPVDRWMANLIYNYPYPYVIDRLCWEFPCIMPSDWDAQYLHGVKNPSTVRDWTIALKAIAKKRGVFTLVFHPHGWIDAEQVAALVDFAEGELSGRVRFLSLAEAVSRLRTNMLHGESLRRADGGDNGIRLLDVNGDGYMDVILANQRHRITRVWDPHRENWIESGFPVPLVRYVPGRGYRVTPVVFGAIGADSRACLLVLGDPLRFWVWNDTSGWEDRSDACRTLKNLSPSATLLRDLDGDGSCELICGAPEDGRIFYWNSPKQEWAPAPFSLPEAVATADSLKRWNGAWFTDINSDGSLDIVVSNPWEASLHVFVDQKKGWRTVFHQQRPEPMGPARIPAFVRLDGTSNGAWFRDGYLWLQNEETGAIEKNHVLRVKLSDLLKEGATRVE